MNILISLFPGREGGAPYYIMTAVAKSIRVQKHEVIRFSGTVMGRNMIVVEAQWKKMPVRLINTHLVGTG
jgi:hypothetical protein